MLVGFETVRRLGGGAQASVWLVRPMDGGPDLAAKCFMPQRAAGVGAGGRGADGPERGRHNESEITQEWRILAQHDHDHLVRVHGLEPLGAPWQGGHALLMDHAAGGSVQDMVAARGPLPVGECVTILTPLGEVLSFLHGRGVVHGDVSPGNVLLTVHGKPVLGDLGFGRLAGQPHGRAGGTPGFFCPQDGEVSGASDVYAMAAVGWFALTGHAPPATRDRMPLGMYVRDVPPELAAALEAGLAESAGQRPPAAAFAQAVFRSARAEPVALAPSVHPSVLPELLTRREARQRRSRYSRLRIHGPALPGRRRGRTRDGRGPRGARWAPRFSRKVMAVAVAVVLAGTGFAGWRLASQSIGASDAPNTDAVASSPSGAAATTASGKGVPGKAGAATAAPQPASSATLGNQASKLPAQIRGGLLSPMPDKALPALAWVRSYALSTADLELLEAVNAAGSPAMAADAKVARELAQARHSYSGLESKVSDATVATRKLVTGGSDAPYASATVSATVTTGPFAEHDSQGGVVFSQPLEQRQQLRIVLVQVRSRWVVQQILPGR
ncbi:serine/threonine protein kinase [Arthrobacter livingstonensis]|uniref:serine/threonine protein kinase n=1 Tax=Arthrobacter livingstonensis TaxID=670078 RepID=UPI0014746FD5|nr:protein kinase [Arthrobacter livingstonensis]